MPTAPNVGELRHRIRFQRPVRSRSSTGQELLVWHDYAEVWAKVDYARTGSGEAIQTDQEIVTNRLIFYIRKNLKIDETYRILYNGREYDILIIRELLPHFTEIVAHCQV